MKGCCTAAMLLLFTTVAISAQASLEGNVDETLTACHDYLTQPDDREDLGEESAHLIIAVCRNPILFNRMNPADQRTLQTLAKNSPPTAPVDHYAASLVEKLRNDDCPRSAATGADTEIRRIWNEVREALDHNDIDRALRHFFLEDQEKYREVFTKIAPRELKALLQESNEISPEYVGDYDATYHIFAIEEGQIYDYQLRLRRDAECNWRIVSF